MSDWQVRAIASVSLKLMLFYSIYKTNCLSDWNICLDLGCWIDVFWNFMGMIICISSWKFYAIVTQVLIYPWIGVIGTSLLFDLLDRFSFLYRIELHRRNLRLLCGVVDLTTFFLSCRRWSWAGVIGGFVSGGFGRFGWRGRCRLPRSRVFGALII